ncbi:MAG: hypothetical protein RL653_802 [Pseudomonadota bacterium]|jgi:hypothetical protein
MSRAAAAAVAALFLVPSAFAQSAQQRRNRQEVQQGKAEMARTVAEHADDKLDFERARGFEARLAAARSARDLNAVAALDVEVERFLAGERREAQREVAQASGEVLRSAGEAVAAAGEARQDAARGRGAAVRADSRRDTRDDVRDLKDDSRDLRAEKQGRAFLARLHGDWRVVQGRFDAPALDARAAVLAALVREQGRELRRNAEEFREDRRELREDRREQREDRRQRK